MRNIYVVTHAQSVHHVEGLAGGWYDTPLTEKGHAQAERVADFLYEEIGKTGTPVYASDLMRTAETAQHIANRFNSDIILDSRLREMSNGEADGKSPQWREQNVVIMPDSPERVDHRIFTGSETRREVGTRINEAMGTILLNNAEDIVVVTHGFTLTFVIMAWFRIPPEHLGWCQFQPSPATVTLLRTDETYMNRYLMYLTRSFAEV